MVASLRLRRGNAPAKTSAEEFLVMTSYPAKVSNLVALASDYGYLRIDLEDLKQDVLRYEAMCIPYTVNFHSLFNSFLQPDGGDGVCVCSREELRRG